MQSERELHSQLIFIKTNKSSDNYLPGLSTKFINAVNWGKVVTEENEMSANPPDCI